MHQAELQRLGLGNFAGMMAQNGAKRPSTAAKPAVRPTIITIIIIIIIISSSSSPSHYHHHHHAPQVKRRRAEPVVPPRDYRPKRQAALNAESEIAAAIR